MIEVLGAITSLVGQHALNQALLFSLAEPLTQALAAWLPTFPCTLHTDISEASLPEAPARSQSHLAAVKNSRTDDKSHRPAINSAAKDSAEKAKQLATSVLTSRLKGSKEPSLLTAQLKGGIPCLSTLTLNNNLPAQILVDSLKALPQDGGARGARDVSMGKSSSQDG